MLVENKLNIGDVISLKLKSGEEIMAKLVSEDTSAVKVENPILIAMSPTGGIALVPFMMGLEENARIEIKHSDILVKTKTRMELTNAFSKEVSGIQPESGGFDPNVAKPTPSFGGGRGRRGGLVQS